MGFLKGAYAIWYRELLVFFREKERVISAIITPLLWIVAFGGGLGASISVNGMNYQEYIFPGIVSMSVLFGSIFFGLYVIWDKKLDFLKEVLVAPVPRSAVFLGKMLGGMSDVIVQICALLIIGALLGFVSSLTGALLALLAGALLSMCMVSLGLIIGAKMSSPEGFNLVMSFVMWPMFLTSGALFPIENLPNYLEVVVKINPMTYGVDLMRLALLGITNFGAGIDLAVLLGASIVFMFLGSKAFEQIQLG
ncbi:MAG TPA: ABC transporter permease [Candidatus Micrarchaeota archaeon]|nr:ABC transporter permease [Candidatus Micrarchaeota archaeon]